MNFMAQAHGQSGGRNSQPSIFKDGIAPAENSENGSISSEDFLTGSRKKFLEAWNRAIKWSKEHPAIKESEPEVDVMQLEW